MSQVTHFAKGNGVEVFDDGYDVCDYVDNAYSGVFNAVTTPSPINPKLPDVPVLAPFWH